MKKNDRLAYLQSLKHDLTEVRILTKDRYLIVNGKREYVGQTISGYYTPDAYEKMLSDVAPFDNHEGVAGVYTTLQNIDASLHARAYNRLKFNVKTTTSDHNVHAFVVFPIDVDSDNPADVSASEAELEVSKQRAREIFLFLKSLGIPANTAMSGNGWHILVYLNPLICNEENAARFYKLGELFSHHYDSDVKNYNPARIWKFYGSYAKKGDNVSERPHRQAVINRLDTVEYIDFDTLESKILSNLSPIPTENVEKSAKVSEPVSKAKRLPADVSLRDWLTHHKVAFDEKPYKGTSKFIVDCPHDPDHKRDAWITDEGGSWQFSCSHNSCKGERSTWAAFRKAIGAGEANPRDKKRDKKQDPKPRRENPIPQIKDASAYFIHDDFNVLAMSQFIQEKYEVWAQDSGVYIYDSDTGIYVPGELEIDAAVRSELGQLRKSLYVTETIKDLSATCRREVPDTSHLIAFKNGVFELNVDGGPIGDFKPHSSSNYLMSVFPIEMNMNPEVTPGSSDFEKWLLDILGDDSGLMRVIYEVIGSIFHKDSVHMQRGILMIGEGGTGKSMLLSQIERMVGRENICARAWGDYGKSDFAFGDLYGKHLSLDSDIDVAEPLSGTIKPAVTGNILTCNKKYQQPFDFNPYATWIGSINRFPRTNDKTWGFFRRWIAIPFNKTFSTNSKFESEKRALWSDPETVTRIVHDALSLYTLAYRNGSYTIPEAAEELSREMYQAANSVISWLDSETEKDDEGAISRADAYQAYSAFCNEKNFDPQSTRNFYSTLRTQGYNVDGYAKENGKTVRTILGIHLLQV